MDDHLDADAAIRKLATACGVSPTWTDHTGQTRHVAADDLTRILAASGVACANAAEIAESRRAIARHGIGRALPPMIVASVGEPLLIPADDIEPRHGRVIFEDGDQHAIALHEHADGFVRADALHRPGYHRLRIGDAETTLAIAPARCFTAADAAGGAPVWGLTAQLYALRTMGDGGIGGDAGVEALCRSAALAGADALALSPTHALFAADPNHFSPYSPSTRLFRNPVYADLPALFGPARVADAVARTGIAHEMAQLEALPLVDWPRACAARLKLMDALFNDMQETDARTGAALWRSFLRFCEDGGAELRDHARFEALHAHYFGADRMKWDWRSWAPEHRDPRSNAVERFASENAPDVQLHMFMQWVADASQASAQAAAKRAGMRIGLIGDLAVGMNAGGSHGWSRPHDLLVGLNIGAPPDPLAPRGQNWGLTTFSPRALRETGFAPFLATLRAMFRHSGGVRIDHVMGLARLWLVPEGEDASHGAYVAYPFNDMLKLVCLESQRHRAIVVGEDLGTVPHGFRERLEQAGVYGMRVMQFERERDFFRKPEWYAHATAAMTSTHDIPTVAGWWAGRDIDVREELDQFGPGQTHADEARARADDRARMWNAFTEADAGQGETPDSASASRAVDAAAEFLARTSAQLALIPVEDVIGAVEQPNLPGTTIEHPNWRRRYAHDARRILDTDDARRRLASFARVRPRHI